MKKTVAFLLVLSTMLCASACSRGGDKEAAQPTETVAGSDTAEELIPLYAKDIKDGTYNITVDCDTSMFRVVDCELTVENGAMRAVMTMKGQGFAKVYMGTGEEALAASEDRHIPAVLDENGKKTVTVPVEALDKEIACAALSARKNTWYDHFLIFRSDGVTKTAPDGEVKIKDGKYSVEAVLDGGSGKARIEDATVEIKDGNAVATIVWSSPYYEYMLIGETKYEPIQTEGNSTFEIPVTFDEKIPVQALTVAMSEPHLIDYTLYFDSKTLKGE